MERASYGHVDYKNVGSSYAYYNSVDNYNLTRIHNVAYVAHQLNNFVKFLTFTCTLIRPQTEQARTEWYGLG